LPRVRKLDARQQRALAKLLDEQVQTIWSRFGDECLQFTEAFNSEMGSPRLRLQSGPDAVHVRLDGGGELVVQLDRENKHAWCVMTSGCSDFGACTVDQPPLGLSIADGQLRFMYGADPMSENGLAVKLLTDFIAMDAPGIRAER
jgi:hypothetical protein